MSKIGQEVSELGMYREDGSLLEPIARCLRFLLSVIFF